MKDGSRVLPIKLTSHTTGPDRRSRNMQNCTYLDKPWFVYSLHKFLYWTYLKFDILFMNL